MESITKRSYIAAVKRGAITHETTHNNFIDKIHEELIELIEECDGSPEQWIELSDIVLVCFNFARHYNTDLLEVMRKKVEADEGREC